MKNIQIKSKPKKIIFDEDGEVVSEEVLKGQKIKVGNESGSKQGSRKRHNLGTSKSTEKVSGEIELRWYEVYPQYNTNGEPLDLKERELNDLNKLCKSSFDSELFHFKNKNPSDAKWLETALHTGTSRDRANAGALLVTSNPMANLQTLETLIGLTKLSNKSSPDAISAVTDLFIESLLPSHRKLMPLSLRGLDWKALQKQDNLSQEIKQKIYAYWQYESNLKELYFEFLKNLQYSIQTGQDPNKNVSIIAASKLLAYAPEKEQMLLSMLINKLGDPSSKVASKALHHLTEVAYKHPNMCGIITNEAEKLLFRNNISERAQHFALCFLAQIAPSGRSDVCTKLVNICFSFFKVLVKKGAVNNKTMQAILRCLQKAIADAKPPAGSTDIMTKEMQDTIYRLVHLADIRISIQTLSLLLQLITVKSEKADRFYNALYRKLLDLDLINIGTKTAAQFLHIIHRAIHVDQNTRRAQAFIKRLLQISIYMPSQMVCGCLIVVNKLLKFRPELANNELSSQICQSPTEEDLGKFDSDGEEKYEDVPLAGSGEASKEGKTDDLAKIKPQGSSWYHAKNIIQTEEKKVSQISATGYDPYHRIPAFAGAEFAILAELHILKEHFHPTVKVFAENIIKKKKIDYYGDPLRDFGLTQFLERFAFKNPKKLSENKAEPRTPVQILYNKSYVPHGTRGKPVDTLTKVNCTEDELFIFNYLEKKRQNQIIKKQNDDDEAESVDDDEFEEYLDSLCKKSEVVDDEEEDIDDFDYLKELGGELKTPQEKRKKKSKDDGDDEDNEIDDDWGNDGDSEGLNEEEESDNFDNELDSDEEGSISLDEDSEMENMSENNSSDEEVEPKSKKVKKMSGKSLQKTLKGSSDVSSLFAAADDFAELLEETGKTKGHGTSSAIFNRDKSSEKQLKWEEKRRNTINRKFKNKNKFGKFSGKKNNKKQK